jgi:pimeloyl-ACP methyl ester carboxylesterase
MHSFGEGDSAYWIFIPAGPRPARAPLVVFTHGWGAMEPTVYRTWIDHIVRRGAILIFPRYQANLRTPADRFTRHAAAALADAVRRIDAGELGVKRDGDGALYVGHSVGGLLAPNLAALATTAGLPRPLAILSVEPGKSWGPRSLRVPLENLSTIPVGVLLVAMAGDQDRLVGMRDAKRIYDAASTVASPDKNLLILHSDDHGGPALDANHIAATSPAGDAGRGGAVDALD